MDSSYYANWLPIHELNDWRIERMKSQSKGRNKKIMKIEKSKKDLNPFKKASSDLDYSYFKMRELKK